MNETELVKKRKQAEAYFKRNWGGYPDHISDFGAYCVEQWLSNARKQETWLGYMAIDYLRKSVPTSYAQDAIVRQADLMLVGKKIKIETNGEHDGFEIFFGKPSTEIESFINSTVFRKSGLSQIERCCMILYYQWGFRNLEIADCLGYTESRTSQLLRKAIEKIRIGLEKR